MIDLRRLTDLDDPQLTPYRDLTEKDLAREQGVFIAEGKVLVQRLLASDFEVQSILLSEKRLAEFTSFLPDDVPVYLLPAEAVNRVLGYKFHSGVMAAGFRPQSPPLTQVVPGAGRVFLTICPEIANADNLGALIRISAGLGVSAMLLGERCCDPFMRQSVRVSMGTIFRLPIIQSPNLLADLQWLKSIDVELIASVLDASADPLRGVAPTQRMGLLLGNEAQGLDANWIEQCNRRVTIPMKLGTDSLNVSVAAGIMLYHFLGEST